MYCIRLIIFFLYLQLTNLTPTKKEIEELQLQDLLVKHKKVSTGGDEVCALSDDDFVDPVPPCRPGASSSKNPSQSKTSIKTFQTHLSRLEASQKSIKSEVENLKAIVKEDRSHFDLSLSMLRDTFLKEV